MIRKWLVSLLMCICGLLVQTQASAIALEYSGLMGGSAAPSGVIDATGTTRTTAAGLLHFKVPGTEQIFDGFCVEPGLGIKKGTVNYAVKNFETAFDNQKQSLIAKLYDDHYESARKNTQTAAIFQLVLWEVLSDSPSLYDLHAGNFQVKSGTLLTLITASTLWLDSLSDWYGSLGGALYESQKYHFMILSSGDSQNQIVVVPEPGVLMLLGIGLLAGIGFMRRRHAE